MISQQNNDLLKRREIITTLCDSVAEISTADGYNFNLYPENITVDVNRPDKVSAADLPLVLVVPGNSFLTPMSGCRYTSGNDTNPTQPDGWSVSLIAYLATSEAPTGEGGAAYEMEDLLADLARRVLANPTLGLSYIQQIYLYTIDPFVDYDGGKSTGFLNIRIKYDFNFSGLRNASQG